MAYKTTNFKADLLISGSKAAIAGASIETGLRVFPGISHFSLDRIVPRPIHEERTDEAKDALTRRFINEVLTPWEAILVDNGIGKDDRSNYKLKMLDQLQSVSGHIAEWGPGSPENEFSWLERNWGRQNDVLSERVIDWHRPWVGDRLFARLEFGGTDTSPPLPAFDTLAQRIPTAQMALAWTSEDMYFGPQSTGIALWQYGARWTTQVAASMELSDSCGQLWSREPIEVAERIRAAGIESTLCRPTVRWTLTKAELDALEAGDTVTLELDELRNVTVGCEDGVDFRIVGHEVTDVLLYENLAGIPEDEAWHRIPGEIGEASVNLTLHSPEVRERNMALLSDVMGAEKHAGYRLDVARGTAQEDWREW